MAFLSGKNNNFRFAFSKPFVPQEIEDKYSPVLNRIPGNMCTTVLDFLNYSIKSVNIQVSHFRTNKQQELLKLLNDNSVRKEINTIIKDAINNFVPYDNDYKLLIIKNLKQLI